MTINTRSKEVLTEGAREMLSSIAKEMRECVIAIDENELGYAKDIILECIRALELDKMYLSKRGDSLSAEESSTLNGLRRALEQSDSDWTKAKDMCLRLKSRIEAI